MASWPSVNSLGYPSYGMTEDNYNPTIQTEFEANYLMTRRRGTRSRKKWSLSWGLLPEAQYQTLLSFVNTATGEMFGWTHPVTFAVYTCTIMGNLTGAIVSPGFRSAKIDIGEI